jgi:hypothetical protein
MVQNVSRRLGELEPGVTVMNKRRINNRMLSHGAEIPRSSGGPQGNAIVPSRLRKDGSARIYLIFPFETHELT